MKTILKFTLVSLMVLGISLVLQSNRLTDTKVSYINPTIVNPISQAVPTTSAGSGWIKTTNLSPQGSTTPCPVGMESDIANPALLYPEGCNPDLPSPSFLNAPTCVMVWTNGHPHPTNAPCLEDGWLPMSTNN